MYQEMCPKMLFESQGENLSILRENSEQRDEYHWNSQAAQMDEYGNSVSN